MFTQTTHESISQANSTFVFVLNLSGHLSVELGVSFCALSLLAAAMFFPHLEPQTIFCISGCVLTTELVSLLFPPSQETAAGAGWQTGILC